MAAAESRGGSDASGDDNTGAAGDACRGDAAESSLGSEGGSEGSHEVQPGNAQTTSDEKTQKKKRRRASDSAPKVYRLVQQQGEARLRRGNARGTRPRVADPRVARSKLVEEQLDDLAAQDTARVVRAGELGRAGWRKLKAQVKAGVSLEIAEALQDLVIVSADGGRRWPVDRGGRIVLTSWPEGERWWQGYPDGALVSGPAEAGDIPRELVLRVAEKAQTEAAAAAKAAEQAAKQTAATAAAAAEAAAVEAAATPAAPLDRAAAADQAAAAAAVPALSTYSYDEQLAIGLQRIHAHRYREAVVNFKRCRAIEPTDPTACYNLACCYSLLKLSGLALRWLSSAVDLGLADGAVLLEDTDLDTIRDAPRFRQLQQRLHRDAKIVPNMQAENGRVGKQEQEGTRGVEYGLTCLREMSNSHVKFASENQDEEEEEEGAEGGAELAAELVDAQLLGLPPKPKPPLQPQPALRSAQARGAVAAASATGASDDCGEDDSSDDADSSSDASTVVSAQTDSDDEEFVQAQVQRQQQQARKQTSVQKQPERKLSREKKVVRKKTTYRRHKTQSNPEPEPEPEPEPSQYHGVSWNSSAGSWQCQIPFEGQAKFIGLFDAEEEAASAHDVAAHESFGADTHCNANGITLNFPTSCAYCQIWARACMAAGEPHEAADWFEQALLEESQPSDEDRPLVAYELAGCYATCLDSSVAISWLSDAIRWGLGTVRAADDLEPHKEAVFASLWRDSRFLTLCAKLDEARNGPALKENARLVRRHRAARASACVKAAATVDDGPTATTTAADEYDRHQEQPEHERNRDDSAANSGMSAAAGNPEDNEREHELDLFFEFWNENVSAMNDLFGRLATRLIPLDLIRTTLGRVIGGLQLQQAAELEDCIASMVGLGNSGSSHIGGAGYGAVVGEWGAPNLFQTEVERVSRVGGSSAAAAAGACNSKHSNRKMSAISRHRSLKTEALCRAASPSQLPQGQGATVPVLARVVDRDEFLSQCAAVASAWCRAAARCARSEWLEEFEAAAVASAAHMDTAEPSLGNGQTRTETEAASETEALAAEPPAQSQPQAAGTGLAVADVNMLTGNGRAGEPAAAAAAAAMAKRRSTDDVSVLPSPVPASTLAATPASLHDGSSSGGGQRRWQDASEGLPEDVRYSWTVATVSAWLRALGFSDSVVARAQEARMDGAALLGMAAVANDGTSDGDGDSVSGCHAAAADAATAAAAAGTLGLETLGSRKLLGKAIRLLCQKEERFVRLSQGLIASPPRPAAAAAAAHGLFASFASSETEEERQFLKRLEWAIADGEEEGEAEDNKTEAYAEAEGALSLQSEDSSLPGGYVAIGGFSRTTRRSGSAASEPSLFSFGDVSSITSGL